MHRRDAVRLAAAGTLGLSMPAEPPGPRAAELPGRRGTEPPGRLKQSVCRWPFGDLPDAEFFPMVQRLGFGAVDLLTEKEWSIARDHGLLCSMGTPTERRDFIRRGLNDRCGRPRREFSHSYFGYRRLLADAGYSQVRLYVLLPHCDLPIDIYSFDRLALNELFRKYHARMRDKRIIKSASDWLGVPYLWAYFEAAFYVVATR